MFAVDGTSWEAMQSLSDKSTLERVVTRGAVFARMKPDQKQTLIAQLQALGYYVGKSTIANLIITSLLSLFTVILLKIRTTALL